MTKTEDRLSLSVGNWIALAALAVVPLGTVVGGWSDLKAESAVTRVTLQQLQTDVAELKAALRKDSR